MKAKINQPNGNTIELEGTVEEIKAALEVFADSTRPYFIPTMSPSNPYDAPFKPSEIWIGDNTADHSSSSSTVITWDNSSSKLTSGWNGKINIK